MSNTTNHLLTPSLFFFLILKTSTGMGQGAAVAPSRIFFSGAPGQVFNQLVEISNTGTRPLLFNVSVKDWERDSTGNKVYYKPGTLPASNARWLEVVPRTIEIPPGSKKSVTVMMRVPDTSAGVTNSMLFFTQVVEQQPAAEKSKAGGIGISIQLEFGIHIYNTPPGFSKRELDFIEFKDSKRNIALKIKNTGEVVTDAYLRFEMTNKVTGEEIMIDPLSLSIMPLAEQIVSIGLPAHIKGKFLIVAILDNGAGTKLKIAEKDVAYE